MSRLSEMRRLFQTAWRSHYGLTVLSQVTSSIGNLGVFVVVAATQSAEAAGRIAIFLSAYQLLVGLVAGACSEAVLLRRRERGGDFHLTAGAGVAILLGGVIGCIAALLFYGLGAMQQLLAMGLALSFPLLGLQIYARMLGLALGKPALVLRLDLLWTVTGTIAVLGLAALGADETTIILVWAGAGCTVGIAMWRAVRGRSHRFAAIRWLRSDWRLSLSLGGDLFLSQLGSQGVLLVAASVLGVASAAALRTCQVLLGPLYILIGATRLHALGDIVAGTVLSQAADRQRRQARTVFPLLALALTALFLTPVFPGEFLFADSWDRARTILPFYGLEVALTSAAVPSVVLLRAVGAGALAVRIRAVTVILYLVAGCGAAVFSRDLSVVAAFGAGTAMLILVLWRRAERNTREALEGPASLIARKGEQDA